METRSVTILTKSKIENTPPIEMIAFNLRDLGHKVKVISYCSQESTRARYLEENIEVISLTNADWPQKNVLKTFEAIKFSHFLDKIIQKEKTDVYWIINPDIIPLLRLNKLKGDLILHTLELYDKSPRYLKYVKQVEDKGGLIIVPEKTRAYVLKALVCLKRLPYVVHNKPYHHPRQRNLICNYADLLPKEILTGKKELVLYQGHIVKYRPVLEIAQAIKNHKKQYLFVAMGKGDAEYVEEIQIAGGVHINHIPSPHHLNLTSWAKIGVMSYNVISLNTLFCAPNKIFEFSGFGIPTISSYHPNFDRNDFPFCRTIKKWDKYSIATEIDTIIDNYEHMSESSTKYFEGINTKTEISTIFDL